MRYPIFLDLSGTRCLVAGFGQVWRRKVASLVASSPQEILVVDPGMPEMEDVRSCLVFARRAFQPADIQGRNLVFAATDSRATNSAIAALCREAGIFCNVADSPEESGFLVPAAVNRGVVTLAISTEGRSPALSKVLKEDIEQWLDKSYAPLVFLLEKLRPLVLAQKLGCAADAEIFRTLCESPLREHLASLVRARNKNSLVQIVQDVLPMISPSLLAECLHELD